MLCRLTMATTLLLLISAARPPAEPTLADLAAAANGADPARSAAAMAALRAAGPDGLAALMAADEPIVRDHAAGRADAAAWRRVTAAADAVAAQRDAVTAGLYWYTDWPSAAAAARASGKPVLALRLLGRLTDEYSCANSRFFRSVLYADPTVAGFLRDHFVLEWEMVRPVPVITIDYGDGRIVRRTITGNSIHYVVTADGRVVDGLPGLYAPAAFVRQLSAAADRAGAEPDALADWHRARAASLAAERSAALRSVGVANGPAVLDAAWTQLARRDVADLALSPAAVAFMEQKAGGNPPTAADAARITASKTAVERPMLRMVGAFQRSMAADTVRNELDLHQRLHAWLGDRSTAAAASADLTGLNRRVYAELFLTPDTDPWLGLAPTGLYDGLPNNGVVTAAAR